MSKIEVDKVDPQSGTALEVGSSGDTTTIPSGANLTIASGATLTNSGTATGFPDTIYNDDAVINDISTLALHQATNNNSSK